jgi:hypothetical protein
MSHVACSQFNSYRGAEKDASPVAAGPRRLIVRTCRHILENGNFCQAPAAGKSAYCRAHQQLRVRLGKMAQARRQREVLKLPPLMDLQAVQVGLTEVQIALATDRIDPAHAKLLRWAMRQAATNLRFILEQERSAARPDVLQTERRQGGIGTGAARKARSQVISPSP